MTVLTVLILFTKAQPTEAHKKHKHSPIRYVLTQLLQQLLGDAGVKTNVPSPPDDVRYNTNENVAAKLALSYRSFPLQQTPSKDLKLLDDAGVIHTFPDFQNNNKRRINWRNFSKRRYNKLFKKSSHTTNVGFAKRYNKRLLFAVQNHLYPSIVKSRWHAFPRII
uniref:Uncharacterized protein n=1 Tax=Photinus pyralis TaxID=7054 RepID=A0A1Y1MLF5_PHOPY